VVEVQAAEAPAPLAYVGLVTRALAFAADAAIINVAALAVAGVVALGLSILSIPDWAQNVLLVCGGALFVLWSGLYFVVFWSTTGETPGNHLMRIRVWRADGLGPLRPRQAVLRLIGLMLAALPLMAGFLPILFDARRRGFQDMLAASVVVSAPERPPG
jgi:uncharacterized RDD family membrane protein YckC